MAANAEDARAALLLGIPTGNLPLKEARKGPILKRVAALEKENQELREIIERIQIDAAWDRKRIAALEKKGVIPSDRTDHYLDILASHLLKVSQHGQAGVTYAQGAKILKISRARICQLRVLIGSDSRFNISWHPSKKNTKIISLKKNNIGRIV